MRILTCRGQTWYRGRRDIHQPLAELCIMLRDADEGGDGSVVVFSDRGLRPCNWMPPGSVINETTEGFEIVHRQRGEYLRIAINTVLDESRVDPGGYS